MRKVPVKPAKLMIVPPPNKPEPEIAAGEPAIQVWKVWKVWKKGGRGDVR